MRSGGCAVQQALTAEAAGMVKQAVVLAKRRGHAQVTPLHVANAMLAAAGGLLRAACQQSHSHPLQCKALELCFNVALNRLPAAAGSPLHHPPAFPAISNALVAAFKRAQAHQRRGAADANHQNQAAALLAVKIELEQLIVSILDDPSVSRVMREAGFSSTQVKNNVEKSISPQNSPKRRRSRSETETEATTNKIVILDPSSPQSPSPSTNDDDDLNIVVDLLTKKQNHNFVLVGEAIPSVEKTMHRLMRRIERGEVPESLKEVKFINLPPFYTFCNVRRELVQQKIQELGFLARSLVGKGVVLYLGDLNWISEYRVSNVERERREGISYYCSVEHMIMEVARLVSALGSGIGRVWLVGIATFQSYMRCRNGYDSLEMIWRLHPLTLPANSLGLSLVAHSGNDEGEAQNLEIGATLLPSWLKDESRRLSNYNDQGPKSLTLSSASPSSSSISNPNFLQNLHFSSPSSNPSSATNSPTSSDAGKFKAFNSRNLNILCKSLEEKIPWQKEIIPEIAGTLLQCRSGMRRRREANSDAKDDTWLFFLGADARAKAEVARNLAELVFGSESKLVRGGVEGFAAAVAEDPRRVFLVEGLEAADRRRRMRIKRAIERGRVSGENGEEFGVCDAIVVLSCERFGESDEREMGDGEEGVSLDLNMGLGEDDHDDLGILENVDRVVVFEIKKL